MPHVKRQIGAAAAAFIMLAGCGGGGGGSLPGGGNPGDPPIDLGSSKTGTARFAVDVDTGKVTVTPLQGDASSRAIFTGTAAQFQSSDLLNDSGELTRRKLAVSIKNNTNEPIGLPGSGFKVMFGEFTNGIATDLRARTTVSTLVGSGGSGSADGPPLSATLSSPHSVLVDNQGTVYFSGYNQSVRMLKNGYVSTIVEGTGPLTAMVWNANGNQNFIYASALNTHKIIRIDIAKKSMTVLAGTGSVGGDDGPGSTARFNLPYSLISLETGGENPDLLVSEGTTGKLRLMQHNGSQYMVSTLPWTNDAPRGMTSLGNGLFAVSLAFLRKVAICNLSGQVALLGSGANGQADGNGDTMQFYEPIGVFCPQPLSTGNRTLYVSESGGVIRQITLRQNGNPLFKRDWFSSTIAGVFQAYNFQDGRGNVAKFLGPVCMALDLSGNILVADSGNQRIRKITPDTNFPLEVGGGANTGVDKVRLANPTEFVPTDTGSMPYILEQSTIGVGQQTNLTPWSLIIPEGVKSFEFTVTIEAETTTSAPPDAVFNPGPAPAPGSPRAMVRTLAGQTVSGYANGSVSSATFLSPTDFAFDDQGVMYVADAHNHAVRRITPSGAVTTVAGIPNNTGFADGTGATATFGNIRGLTVTGAGDVVYVCDATNNVIKRIALNASANPEQPYNWQVSTIAGVAGSGSYANGNGSAARFNGPWGIALTNGGELLISEIYGKRIRRLQPIGADLNNPTNWQVSLVAGHPAGNNPGVANLDGTGQAARFGELRGISIAPSGEAYVADWSNGTVRRISPAGVVTTVAGGVLGYADSDTGSSVQFQHPTDVAVDKAGYIYVADPENFLIRRISPAGAVRTVAGTGALGTTDGPGNVAAFKTIHGLQVTNAGDLVIGDATRIRLIERLISSGAL